MAGAICIVAAVALLTVAALGALSGDEEQRTVGLDVDRSTTTTSEARTRRTTTTTRPPDVLGDVTTRDLGTTTTTTTATATTAASSASAPAPAPPTTAAPAPPPSSPPTTTCRNSTDPACGPLVWDPAPDPSEVEVVEVAVPLRAVVGEPVTFAVDHVERAGADAVGACAGWTVDDPGVPNVSTCEAVNHACDRHGPHDPPAPRTDRVRVERTVTFTTPGEYEVHVGGHTATHLADGCANPYLASWSRTYLVVVEDAGG